MPLFQLCFLICLAVTAVSLFLSATLRSPIQPSIQPPLHSDTPISLPSQHNQTFVSPILGLKPSPLPPSATGQEAASNYVWPASLVDGACEPLHLDPWHPSITNHTAPLKKGLNCRGNKTQPPPTFNSTSGQLNVKGAGDCSYRCFWRNGDVRIHTEPWVKVSHSAKPGCQFIQVRCMQRGNHKLDTAFTHFASASPRSRSTPPSSNSSLPSVLILILDSVSQSAATRWLPKAKNVAVNELGAIELAAHYKVGLNSFPNSAALLAGLFAPLSRTSFLDSSK